MREKGYKQYKKSFKENITKISRLLTLANYSETSKFQNIIIFLKNIKQII